jgi:hypothetical protein
MKGGGERVKKGLWKNLRAGNLLATYEGRRRKSEKGLWQNLGLETF